MWRLDLKLLMLTDPLLGLLLEGVGAENHDLFELRECHFRAYKSLGSGPTPSNDPCNGYARIKIITKRHINNRSINSFVKLKTFWSPRIPSLIFRDLSIKNDLFIYLFRF
jgi:hypothetical protein